MYFIIFSYIFLNLEKKERKKFAGLKKSSTFAPAIERDSNHPYKDDLLNRKFWCVSSVG
jgi:hypothetical protein